MGRTRTDTAAGIVLDAGALIALLDRALAQGRTLRVPAGVVGQAWRGGRRQATLAGFLRCEEVEIIPLDAQLVRACVELCGATDSPDVIDASIAILARERRDPIATSDPDDLRRLYPAAQIIPI